MPAKKKTIHAVAHHTAGRQAWLPSAMPAENAIAAKSMGWRGGLCGVAVAGIPSPIESGGKRSQDGRSGEKDRPHARALCDNPRRPVLAGRAPALLGRTIHT